MKKTLSVLVIAALLSAAGAYAAPPARHAPNMPKNSTAPAPAPAAVEKTAEPAAAPAAEGGGESKCPAAEAEYVPPQQPWPQKGIFGAYDKAAVQRGFQVYKEVCSNCHSLKYVAYRDLEQLGYTPAQVKTVASAATFQEMDDNGQMVDRPGRASDHFKPPFPNDKAARTANNGALPPDMSLLVKAREHGEDYIYAILTGYEAAPSCAPVMPGMNWNKYFPPHQIAMPKPLNDGQVGYTDGTPNNLAQEARDIAQFLAWASEPHMEQRKEMGLKVLLFMLVFCGIMGAAKCKVWEDVR
jgi:ubiquinol-cytochrome c reductase cytochrome c1 subunit